jgi:eukaryotic-like serine/threonine-protein kinase
MNETTQHRDSIDLLAEEFAERHRRGERPTVEEYAAAHPELAAGIRDLFPTLAMIEELAPSDASEPEASARGTSIEVKPLDRIGDFRILREIGRGGMGIVYEAEQESLGRRVALKVLPLHAASDPKLLARFRRESRAAGQLHHTNIVPIFEVGEYGDICWYAMQYIPGQALDEIVRELQRLRSGKSTEPLRPSPMTESLIKDSMARGPQLNRTEAYQPAKETACATADPTPHPSSNRSKLEIVELDFRLCCRNVARIGLQAAEALAYAHSRGVVHRDIKPSNLLLDTAGIVWVTDFGLAKTQDHALTETGDIVGTVRYMAPERFRGDCDARSDIYSLGVTLYELLTLRPAFDHNDRLKLIESIGKSEPARPRAIESQVPRDVETIVLKAIDKDPRRRYPNADAMAADLRRYLNDEPIQARRTGPLEKSWRWIRRNPVVTGLTAAVLLALLIGQLLVYREKTVAETERNTAQKERDDAKIARDELKATLYASQMNLVQSAYEADNLTRALDILGQQPTGLRGFEWNYWMRQCRGDGKTVRVREFPSTALGNHAAFSDDGRFLATSTTTVDTTNGTQYGRTMRLWDVGTGDLRITAPPDALGRAAPGSRKPAFSPDGELVAMLNDYIDSDPAPGPRNRSHSRIVVRETRTGRERFRIETEGFAANIAFTRDGKKLVGVMNRGVSAPAEFKSWDVETGIESERVTLDRSAIGPPALSPNEKTIALLQMSQSGNIRSGFGERPPLEIGLFDREKGTRLWTYGGRRRWSALAFSPDGRWLAAIDLVGTEAVILDAATGQEYRRFAIRTGIAENPNRFFASIVAFTPDGAFLIAAGSWSPTAQVWSVEAGRLVRSLRGHTREIVGIGFDAAAERLLTVSLDQTVRTWPMPKAEKSEPSRLLSYQAVSPDGDLVAASDSAANRGDIPALVIRQTHDGKIVRRSGLDAFSSTLPASTNRRRTDQLTFSANGKLLVVTADDDQLKQTVLRVVDVATGQVVRTIPIGRQITMQILLDMSADGRRLAAEWLEIRPDGRPFDPNERTTHHMVWDFASGKELLNVTAERGPNIASAISADGRMLAAPLVADGRTVVRLWDIDSGQKLRDIATESPVRSLAFGPSGRGVLVLTDDRGEGVRTATGKAYDTSTGDVLVSVRGVFGRAVRIAYRPDGRRLAISAEIQETQTGEVKVWDTESQRELMTMRLPETAPRALRFTPDGHKLIMLGRLTGPTIWDGTPLPE